MTQSDQNLILATALDRLANVLERLEPLLDNQQNIGTESSFINKYDAAKLLDVHPQTLNRYREEWIEGVHWVRQRGKIMYNPVLLKDWQANRNDPQAHLRAIENWQRQQLCNQRRKKST